MKKKSFQATSLRLLLTIAVLSICAVLVCGFCYAHDWLQHFAAESNINISEEISPDGAQNIDQSQQASAAKASSIVLSSQNYLEKIKIDIDKYATDNSISISVTEAPQNVIDGAGDSIISGTQSKFITINFNGAVVYTNLLKFINGIETNIPKIKIMGISINRIKDSPGSVQINPITAKVYVR